jgi:hypothetical protein
MVYRYRGLGVQLWGVVHKPWEILAFYIGTEMGDLVCSYGMSSGVQICC